MLSERQQMLTAKVNELISMANRLYNTKLPPVAVRFDLRGRCAGQAGYRPHQNYWFLRFNRDMLLSSSWDELYKNTVPHEVAHIVCMFLRIGQNHDSGWRRVCIALGGDGQRCHSEKVTFAKGKTYSYTTSTGRVVMLSSVRHRRIQHNFMVYRCKDGGHIDKSCSYSVLEPA